jgi:N-acetylglucosamine malate deacetylase 1
LIISFQIKNIMKTKRWIEMGHWWAITLCCFAWPAGQAATDGVLRIIVFGAHPDDCELKAGGAAAMWAAKGHKVKFVSTTNGDIGHATEAGGPLAKRRTAEVERAAKILGIESEVLDIHDGELMPTLENRRTFTRLIREWKADVVIGPRPCDYHPDHRYTGVLMQDAAFMVTVPSFCPETPHLARNPVFFYLSDGFRKPYAFDPAVVVSIDPVFEQRSEAIWQLESQIESLWVKGDFERVVPVPKDPALREARRLEVREQLGRRCANTANQYRPLLVKLYGEEKGRSVKYAEAFELCEYGRQPSPEELKRLFPFFGE